MTRGLLVDGVDPHDDAAFRRWYHAFRAGTVAGRLAPLVWAYEELSTSLRHPDTRLRRSVIGAFDDGQVVGTLLLELSLVDNTHVAEMQIAVPPGLRGRGVGAALFTHADRVATEAGRTTYLSEVDVPLGETLDAYPGSRFARSRGFSSEHSEDHLVLDLPADPALVAGIRVRAADAHGGYDLVSWAGRCPDEHLVAVAAMRTAMSQDLPLGELDLTPEPWDVERVRTTEQRQADQGFASLTTAARAPDGLFAGYSELLVPAHNPGEVLQEDTLVVRAHRGHRLGAAMKAANLALLAERYPDRARLHTWTAGDNGAMQAVNREFGFRVVEQLHEFQRRAPDG